MATIKDVARESGVSIATVSRVFNDSGLVSEDTQKVVREVALRLNYWPNAVARSLITNRTHTLGVLLPDLHGEFFSGIIRGIDRAARAEGFHLLVSSSHADTEQLIVALRSMRGRIDGLIVMAPDVDAPSAIRASAGDMPIVLLDAGESAGYDGISIANFDGAYAAVRHLMRLGHRRVATVTGPARNLDAQQRLGGYRAALADGDGECDPRLELHGDFTEPSGFEAASQLLRLEPRPTAVFVGNDHMAVGVLGALTDAGMRVPDDLALVGFDDIEMARYLTPPLTTVRVDTFALGECAVRCLLGRALGRAGGEPRREQMPTTLVVRRSCGSTRPGPVEVAGRRVPQPWADPAEPA